MSVSVKKYPTTFNNDGLWTNPANATLAEDGVCATKSVAVSGTWKLFLSGYGFTLPLNAILDNIFITHKGIIASAVESGQQLFFELNNGVDANSAVVSGGACAASVYGAEIDVLPGIIPMLTPNDINTENPAKFVAFIFATNIIGISSFRVDSAYIRVVYHLPVAKKGLMDGFIFVS
jgi:hypothetical protein